MAVSNTCRECGVQFQVADSDLAFFERVSPRIGGTTHFLPPPSLCPQCRFQRRLAHRNQIFVYTRPCSWSGKTIFSMYTEDAPFPVVSRELWWGDGWDPHEYGRDFDFSRPFFDQFGELRNSMPHPPLSIHHDENSDYCNHAGQLRNCYFIFNTNQNEECLYCETVPNCNHCIDCSRSSNCNWCYDCVECLNCHNLQSSECCDGCADSWFLLNCRSCRDCIACANLRQSQYCVFNKQLTRAEYEAYVRNLDLSSQTVRSELRRKAEEFFLTQPRPHAVSSRLENGSGNYLFESRNVQDCYSVRGCDELRYSFLIYRGAKSCFDLSMFGDGAELLYDCLVCGLGAFNLRFCYDCWDNVRDLDYCIFCPGSSNLFGCVALRRKQHCILNKPYSAAEYAQLTARIIAHMRETGEWGEFFPIALSAIPYNRSMAQRYFPLSKPDALQQGYQWQERDVISGANSVAAENLPDGLPEADHPIVVRSSRSDRPYRITAEEIKRYKKIGVPLPRTTYDERMEARQLQLGGIKLHDIRCAKTGKPLRSTFPASSPWIIWDRDEYENIFGV